VINRTYGEETIERSDICRRRTTAAVAAYVITRTLRVRSSRDVVASSLRRRCVGSAMATIRNDLFRCRTGFATEIISSGRSIDENRRKGDVCFTCCGVRVAYEHRCAAGCVDSTTSRYSRERYVIDLGEMRKWVKGNFRISETRFLVKQVTLR